MNKLAKRLTEERERYGSLRAASRAMGVATGTYEGWQRGWRKPREPKQIAKIAKFLGVREPVILGWLGYLTEEEVAGINSLTRPYVKARQRDFALVTAS